MNDKKRNLSILVCYENDRGGETKATEAIYREFSKNKSLKLKTTSSEPLSRTDFRGYFAWILAAIGKWARVILPNRNTDWVYTTTFTAGFAAALLRSLSNFKICFHYHGSRLPEKEGGLSQGMKYKFTFWLHQFFLKRAELILAPSNYSKNLFKKQFSATKDKKIVVIPNGVDLKVFKPVIPKTKLALRKKYNIQKDAPVILAIGRLHKKKGTDLLLLAIRLLKDKAPNVLLLIAHPQATTSGEKSYKEELNGKIVNSHLTKNVVWVVDEKDISNLYAMSNLVVLLSEEENFPLIMLEALASKVIFMGTPVGGVKEMLNKIDNRLIIRDRNPVNVAKKLWLILKLRDYQRLVILQKGYKIAKQFTWKKTSKLISDSLKSYY